jgi:16S rRNA (uracil1498-N3)-methyltransferase
MARFFLPPDSWLENPALAGDEARHLSQVLRIKTGASIVVFDGEGRRAPAEVLDVSRDRVSLKLGESTISRLPRPVITLAQAIPKGKNMDFIVQKSVELGVAAIQPLVTKNTIVQPGDGKSEKWRRTALEACKQCGQDRIPEIFEPLPFDRWMEQQRSTSDLKIIASLAPGARPFREILGNLEKIPKVTLLIGPEGDFSTSETQFASASEFQAVTLGEIILRVETATLYCLSALRYQFDQQF